MEDKHRQTFVSGVLILGLISISLGLGQLLMGKESILYFWDITNHWSAVGTFANANHQTIFAALLIPLFMSYAARYAGRFDGGDEGVGLAMIFGILLVLIVIGVISAGSLAGYLLAIVGLFASLKFVLFSRGKTNKVNTILLLACILLVLGAAIVVYTSPQLLGLGVTSLGTGEMSRIDTFRKTFSIIKDNFFLGTGLGSFLNVFPFYENPQTVTNRFMNHAHNDWLEIIMELGLIGFSLILLALFWLFRNFARLFSDKNNFKGRRISRAAAIAVILLLLHSMVDYPLRTPFLSLLFFVFVGLSVTKPLNLKNSLSEASYDKKKQLKL